MTNATESICKTCRNMQNCGLREPIAYLSGCSQYRKKKVVTNADRLFRNASDEDLACFAAHAGCPYQFGADISFECKLGEVKEGCNGCWLDWLRQEANHV